MSSIRQKITISLPRDREDVWDSFLEHLRETGQTNRSAAIIALIEKALDSPASDSENVSGLYELERISRQVEEIREQIAELTRLVSGRIGAPDVGDDPPQVQHTVPQEDSDVARPEAEERTPDGNAADEVASDECQAVTNDEEAADQRDESSTEREANQGEVIRETAGTPQRYARVWSNTEDDWEWAPLKD